VPFSRDCGCIPDRRKPQRVHPPSAGSPASKRAPSAVSRSIPIRLWFVPALLSSVPIGRGPCFRHWLDYVRSPSFLGGGGLCVSAAWLPTRLWLPWLDLSAAAHPGSGGLVTSAARLPRPLVVCAHRLWSMPTGRGLIPSGRCLSLLAAVVCAHLAVLSAERDCVRRPRPLAESGGAAEMEGLDVGGVSVSPVVAGGWSWRGLVGGLGGT
jgi:hypothetical protein